MGTPYYIAPETIKNCQNLYFKTDVWAVGIIGYYIATKHRPFHGKSINLLFKNIVNEEVSYISIIFCLFYNEIIFKFNQFFFWK